MSRPVRDKRAPKRASFFKRFYDAYVESDCRLSDEEMKRLGEHKYSAVDTSYLDELCMKRFWESLVPLLPMWIAPNLITLIGLVINLTTCLILSAYCSTAKESAPGWTYFLAALGLFFYQTLDALDGKQARRTGSSSPLGELFDHGCDGVSQVFVTMMVCYALALGHIHNGVLAVNVLSIVLYYCAHWSTYCTGQLRFAKFDVTEAQMSVISVLLISAFFGPEVFAYSFMGISLRLIIILSSFATSIIQVYKYLQSILCEGVGKNGSTVADSSVVFPVFPLLMIIIPFCTIYSKSPTTVYDDHITLYCLLFGAISAKLAMRLVIAHMSKSELRNWDHIFFAPLALILNQYFDLPIGELSLCIIAMVYAWASVVIYSVEVCQQFCEYLNINCFTLGPRTKGGETKKD